MSGPRRSREAAGDAGIASAAALLPRDQVAPQARRCRASAAASLPREVDLIEMSERSRIVAARNGESVQSERGRVVATRLAGCEESHRETEVQRLSRVCRS